VQSDSVIQVNCNWSWNWKTMFEITLQSDANRLITRRFPQCPWLPVWTLMYMFLGCVCVTTTGTPFNIKVSSATDASKVKVTGPGLQCGLLVSFQSDLLVETRGAGPGRLTVRVRGPKGMTYTLRRRARKTKSYPVLLVPKSLHVHCWPNKTPLDPLYQNSDEYYLHNKNTFTN